MRVFHTVVFPQPAGPSTITLLSNDVTHFEDGQNGIDDADVPIIRLLWWFYHPTTSFGMDVVMHAVVLFLSPHTDSWSSPVAEQCFFIVSASSKSKYLFLNGREREIIYQDCGSRNYFHDSSTCMPQCEMCAVLTAYSILRCRQVGYPNLTYA